MCAAYHLATTRFTEGTWQENCEYRNTKNGKVSCLYASPLMLDRRHIKSRDRVFVIEMNNSRNRIEGIGLIQNYPFIQKYRVYCNEDYNRYIFMGKYRVDRSEIVESELVDMLELLCFKGKNHYKRLRGITRLPKNSWTSWCEENWYSELEANNNDNQDKDEENPMKCIPNIMRMIKEEFRQKFTKLRFD